MIILLLLLLAITTTPAYDASNSDHTQEAHVMQFRSKNKLNFNNKTLRNCMILLTLNVMEIKLEKGTSVALSLNMKVNS